ncbi:MAG: NADH:flavin oxidoreductase [Chloroflexia bacterium]
MPTLFEPGRIGNLVLRNRLIKSATFEGMGDADGTPQPALGRFHRRIAQGGVGMNIVAFASVHPTGRSYANQCLIDRDELVPAWKDVADAVHQAGGLAALQLVHCGRTANPQVTGSEALAPSPVRDRYSLSVPREIDEGEIAEMIEAFGQAAGRAKAAGFDAVQIHAAHGYLISQFLSPFTNRRRDAWGGDPERRRRFLLEVYRRVRREVGPDYPVLVKLNVQDHVRGGLTPEEALPAARALAEEGVDLLELSAGFSDSVFHITRGDIPTDALVEGFSLVQRIAIKAFLSLMRDQVRLEREAYNLPDALPIRQALPQVPMSLVGGMRSRAVMEEVLAQGFDFVSLGRPLIRQPNLPRLLEQGQVDAASCISCNRCLLAMVQQTGVRCRQIAPEGDEDAARSP